MNWERYRYVMEHDAIKTDDMATEDTYFMATHMPMSKLEVYTGGRTSSAFKEMDEATVFEELVVNPKNEHRMIIVRGDNGTGKSHLIRYLKAKFENSPATIYNPEKENLIFLRRLNNSIRGVFKQLLDQNVIKDPAVADKFRKFVDSTEAMDKESFKETILSSYIVAVSNDKSGTIYNSVTCKNIASYLWDRRVREHLLREGGAISRCYNIITAPSNQVLQDTEIFQDKDFNQSKIISSVMRQADPSASDFAMTLKEGDDEVKKIVDYLNKFASKVIQHSSGISSESTKSVFELLRKELKKQGQNLTLFIEDFTGFTGIDSELITVLSTEHGGDYEDLCRVTAIIGITNYYYDQFKDNFTDRVTHQISVTDRSYGDVDFLVQLTARYLNAIYCSPELLHKWHGDNAPIEELPVSDFKPPCKWEDVEIVGKPATLYPFSRQSLRLMYEHLSVKSPRMFLKEVIRSQLKEYFDGKQYGEDWSFPLNPWKVQMQLNQHASSIDMQESLSVQEKQRLQSVFGLWGDGTAYAVKQSDGEKTIGGVNVNFLKDIGLGKYKGIGSIEEEDAETTASTGAESEKQVSEQKGTEIPDEIPSGIIDTATKLYRKHQKDIQEWLTETKDLVYHSDYRDLLRQLICGDARQVGIINWQDVGIPAYVAKERLSDLGSYYIEGQGSPEDEGARRRALVYMDRSPESRDTLLALISMKHTKGWEFEGSAFYQQRLINWLEKRRDKIIENVTGVESGKPPLPYVKWCLAVQYLKARVLGMKINTNSPIDVVASLFDSPSHHEYSERKTKEWNDLIKFIVNNKTAEVQSSLTLMQRSAATTLGTIYSAADAEKKSFFRSDELIIAVESLISSDWDIEDELPEILPPKHLLYNPGTLLKELYPRIRKVVLAEHDKADELINEIEELIGPLNKANILEAIDSVRSLFSAFAMNGILGGNDLRTKYEAIPIEIAEDILKKTDELIKVRNASPMQQLASYSDNLLDGIARFLHDIQLIVEMALKQEALAKQALKSISVDMRIEQMSEDAKSALIHIYEQIEKLEVYDAAK